MGLFGGGAKKRKLSHMKNLISIATADGHFDEQERALVYSIADRLGLSEEEMGEVVVAADKIKFHVPSSESEKIELVYDLIQVMMVDGEMEDNELILCRSHIKKLDYPSHMVDMLINAASNCIRTGLDREVALKKLIG